MKIIGLTGGIGSGKSVVSSILKQYGGHVIDSDQVGHDVILKGKPAYKEIVDFFGDGILNEKREIEREKLGKIVFSQKEKLKKLNSVSHKYIVMEILSTIETIKNKKDAYNFIVIEVPLLIESDLKNVCDEIWAVYCDEKARVERIIKRDGFSYEEALNRVSSQKDFSAYQKIAHVVIDNTVDMDTLKENIRSYLKT